MAFGEVVNVYKYKKLVAFVQFLDIYEEQNGAGYNMAISQSVCV